MISWERCYEVVVENKSNNCVQQNRSDSKLHDYLKMKDTLHDSPLRQTSRAGCVGAGSCGRPWWGWRRAGACPCGSWVPRLGQVTRSAEARCPAYQAPAAGRRADQVHTSECTPTTALPQKPIEKGRTSKGATGHSTRDWGHTRTRLPASTVLLSSSLRIPYSF